MLAGTDQFVAGLICVNRQLHGRDRLGRTDSWRKKQEQKMSVPATIAHTVQQAQEWLKQVRDYADLEDEQHAYSVLRAVLHQLRDRPMVLAHAAAQSLAQLLL
jgi:uncharacterized protein